MESNKITSSSKLIQINQRSILSDLNLAEVINIKNALKNKTSDILPNVINRKSVLSNKYKNKDNSITIGNQNHPNYYSTEFVNNDELGYLSFVPRTPGNTKSMINLNPIPNKRKGRLSQKKLDQYSQQNNLQNNLYNHQNQINFSTQAFTEILNTEGTVNDSFYEKMYKNFKKENKKTIQKMKQVMNTPSSNKLDKASNLNASISKNPKTPKNEIPKPSNIITLFVSEEDNSSYSGLNFANNYGNKNAKSPKNKKRIVFEENLVKLGKGRVSDKSENISKDLVRESYFSNNGDKSPKYSSSPSKFRSKGGLDPTTPGRNFVDSGSIKMLEDKRKLNAGVVGMAFGIDKEVINPIDSNQPTAMSRKPSKKGIFCCLPFLCK